MLIAASESQHSAPPWRQPGLCPARLGSSQECPQRPPQFLVKPAVSCGWAGHTASLRCSQRGGASGFLMECSLGKKSTCCRLMVSCCSSIGTQHVWKRKLTCPESRDWHFSYGIVLWVLPGAHQCILRTIPVLTQIQAVAIVTHACNSSSQEAEEAR